MMLNGICFVLNAIYFFRTYQISVQLSMVAAVSTSQGIYRFIFFIIKTQKRYNSIIFCFQQLVK